MPQKDERPKAQTNSLPLFIWELDELHRARLRQQRENTPYPSQMNGLIDSYESLLTEDQEYKPEASGGPHD